MSTELEKIRQSILDYQRLRKHTDPAFAQALTEMKRWQHSRMQATYASLLKNSNTAALVTYFLEDIYGGIELSDILKSLSKSLRVADKLFTDLSLIRLALEFNTLNGFIDQRITEALIDTDTLTSLDEAAYVSACQQSDVIEDHLRSIALVGEFAVGLDETVHNPVVYGAFKLGKLPAKLGGLGRLYTLLEKGFGIIRALPEAESAIRQIVDHEALVHQRMQRGDTPCFIPLA